MLLIGSATFAQRKFTIGPKVGFGHSTITDPADGVEGETKYLIGVQGDYKFKSNMSLGAEVYYNKMGVTNNSVSSFMYMDYVNIPVLFRYFPVGGLNVHAGPQVAFMTSSDVNSKNANYVFNDTNFSVVGGAGYRFQFGLTIDARYDIGLSDYTPLLNSKTRYFSVSAGWLF